MPDRPATFARRPPALTPPAAPRGARGRVVDRRGWILWLLPVLAIGPGAATRDAAAQNAAPAATPRASDRPEPARPPLFHVDRAAARQVLLGRRALAAGEPTEAIDFARLALRAEHDSVLPDGVPVRAAAAELLERVRAAEPRLVELRLGAAADQEYAEIAPRGDSDGLALIAARFPGTHAGRRAAARLADLELDRGRYASAARLFDDLHGEATAPEAERDRWRLKAAVAHWRAGDPGAAKNRFDAVDSRTRIGFVARLRAGEPGRAVDAGDLPTVLGPPGSPGGAVGDGRAGEWPWVGRLPGRSAATPGTSAPEPVNAVGGPTWTANLADLLPRTSTEGPGRAIAAIVRQHRAGRGESLWPAARPLALAPSRESGAGESGAGAPGADGAGDAVVVFSTPAGVAAVDAADGTVRWESGLSPASEYYRLTRAEEEPILSDRGRGTVTGVRNLHEERGYRDATSGALSADERHVYAVRNDDLPKLDLAGAFGRGGFTDPSRRPRANRLVAYDRRTGRARWAAGGTSGERGVGGEGGDPTAGTFFCGPPLPTEHGLAAIGETGGVLRAFVLDPADGSVRRVLPLAEPPLPQVEPPRWRTAGLGIAEGAGLWVVSTASGGAAALDPRSGGFAWTYRYESTVLVDGGPDRGPPLMSASEDDQHRWADRPPQIAAGRVLLTPPDSDELHCLDLATGEPRWTRPRGVGRQVAGVIAAADGTEQGAGDSDAPRPGPTVLLVGDDGVRGLALADGSERWFTPLPQPAGDAVVAGGLLLVPLSDDTIAALRTRGGGVVNRLPAGGAAGNLIAAGGRLVSQWPTGVAAFRTRDETAAEIEAAFAEEAGDPESRAAALLLRAGLRLQSGEEADAVADLIAAAAVDAPAGGLGVAARAAAGRARDRLSEVLAEGLRRDFPRFAPLLTDAAPVLEPDPTGEVARAYADGLTNQGRAAEAFRVLARAGDGGSRPPVTAPAWARPRLADLFVAATPEQRTAMAAEVAAIHGELAPEDPKNAENAEAFAHRFGALCGTAAWREQAPRPGGAVDLVDAALRRAAAAVGDDPRTSPVGAERLLRWAASRPGAAPADELLGELYRRAGDDLAASHLLGEPAEPAYAGRAIAAAEAEDRGRLPTTVRLPVGAAPPWAAGGRLSVDNVGPRLRWQADDGRTRFTHVLSGGMPAPGSRALWDGHLLAVGLGDRVEMLDTLARPGRAVARWRAPLTDGLTTGRTATPADPTFVVPAVGGADFDGPVVFTPRQLVLRAGSGLVARRPLTGEALWRRAGVPPLAKVIGDDRTLLVLPAGSRQAWRLRAGDGARIDTVEAPPQQERWLERGTRVWTNGFRAESNAAGGGVAVISCLDLAPPAPDGNGGVAAPRTVWSRSFPLSTVFRPDDAGTALTAVTPQRRAFVLDLETGADLENVDLGPGPEPVAAWGVRGPAGWTAFVASGGDLELDRRFDLFGVRARKRATVAAYGLRGGGVAWSRPVAGPPADVWQPPALPILALPGIAAPEDGRSIYRRRFVLGLYDSRNGAELAVKGDLGPLTPVDWEPGASRPGGDPPFADRNGSPLPLRLRTRGPDLAVTLTDGPPAAPVRLPASEPPENDGQGS